MKKLCIIVVAFCVLAVAAVAQSLAPFADPNNCPGLIYYQDFTKSTGLSGWNYGGTNDLDGGNSPTGPNSKVTDNSNGLTLTISGNNDSTMINTSGKFYHLYGYYEMTASLDQGLLSGNMNSAFWLMAQNGGWPPEIDAQETLGPTGDTAVHSLNGTTTGVSYQWNMQPGTHVWGVDWTAKTIRFYIDGQQVAQSNTPADFNQPMFLILSGIGRNGGTGHMTVQNIRVFQDMASALSCVPTATPASGPTQTVAQTDPQATLTDLQRQADALTAQAPADQPTTPPAQPQSIAALRAQQLLGTMPNAPTPPASSAVAAPASSPAPSLPATSLTAPDASASPSALQTAEQDLAKALQDLQALGATPATVSGSAAPAKSQVGIGQQGWHPRRRHKDAENDNDADDQ